MIHSANVLLQVDYVPGIMLSTRDKNKQKSFLYSTNIDGLPALVVSVFKINPVYGNIDV